MRRTIIAVLMTAEAFVFCGIVRYGLVLGSDLQRPYLAIRTMHVIATAQQAVRSTQREIAAVTHYRAHSG